MATTPASTGAPNIIYQPQIFALRRLFGGSERKDRPWGFPERSSILISGAPGAGKTTFALAMARGVLFANMDAALPTAPTGGDLDELQWGTIAVFPAGRPPGIGKNADAYSSGRIKGAQAAVPSKGTDIRVYYVSNENSMERLETAFAATGWFEDSDPLFGGEKRDKFRLIGKPIDTSRPPPTSDELINALTHELRQVHAQAESAKAIIIVDSLSSLLRDCHDRGEERRQSHEFMHRLETAVGREHLALIFFLSEESSGVDSSTVLIEEYVVHFVFRLRLKDTGLGRRLRTLEIVKSHGMPLHIGEHTWSILTNGHSVENVLSLLDLQKYVQRLALGPCAEEPSAQGSQADQEWGVTGTPGLDEMLNFTQPENELKGHEYWIYRELGMTDEGWREKLRREARVDDSGKPIVSRVCGLRADSVTVLIGPSGTGKMTMCRQFLEAGSADMKVLYINFERRHEDLANDLGSLKDRLSLIVRRRGNLDVNALMAEIRFAVRSKGIRRVAIDGLSNILAGRTAEDSTRLIENLIFTFKDISARIGAQYQKHPIALFISYEPETISLDPLGQGARGIAANNVPRLSAFADNVIVLRPVVINDQLRQTIYIAKAKNLAHDRTVREVCFDAGSAHLPTARIEPGLEAFTGLFSPDSMPARVQLVLQLFHENRSERKYNQWLSQHLKNTFGYNVELFAFSRNAITHTLEEFASPTSRVPPANVKVYSLDEWEVRDGANELLHLRPFERSPDKPKSLASESDFWAWEIGKIKLPDAPHSAPKLRAIPCYLDFGIFCFNLEVASTVGLLTEAEKAWAEEIVNAAREEKSRPTPEVTESREHWRLLTDRLPRLWARVRNDGKWFESPDRGPNRENQTVVDWMARAAGHKTGRNKMYCGFAFDLAIPEVAAVTLLELAWAFGAPEKAFPIIGESEKQMDAARTREPVAHALRFLMFLIVEGLMPRQVSVADSKLSLFSRHFYSTLADIVGPEKRDLPGAPGLVAVPFFPTGVSDDIQQRQTLCFDIVDRLERFIGALCFTLKAQKNPELSAKLIELKDRVESARRKLEPLDLQNKAQMAKISSEVAADFDSWSETLAKIATLSLADETFQINAPPPEAIQGLSGGADGEQTRYAPQAGALDCRDILEFSHRHNLRVSLFKGLSSGVGTLLTDQAAHAVPKSAESLLPTGYCCTGSWMVGVHTHTHSAGLSCQLIDEITSLECAQERARRGAGLPARKDFYEYHGRQPVQHARYLQWNDLLRACGARARQRNRAIEDQITVPEFNLIVGRYLRACLQFAELNMGSYRGEDNETTIQEIIRQSDYAAEQIFIELNTLLTKKLSSPKRAR